MTRHMLVLALVATSLSAQDITERYRAAAARIIEAAKTDEDGYRKLAYLCDRIGNRPSGSASLEQAIDWAIATMTKDGLENARRIPAKVPHWVRGKESVTLIEPKTLEPANRQFMMLGLGGSVGTPPEGITAEVIPVANFDELE
jgi:hypothetical protein